MLPTERREQHKVEIGKNEGPKKQKPRKVKRLSTKRAVSKECTADLSSTWEMEEATLRNL
ncbi:hypothetical protein DBV39_10735 [Orrella marina]|uniref:Uncharacterized protein n=1 Tax=Orrella marina TaxID=2163011 RepID=A0A2R4XJU6_9BURK|nr:hypothetical protein DBV39_10735 [Orrella marina]